MSEILVERHWKEPLTEADLMAGFKDAAACLGMHRVDWKGSRLSVDGRDLFCHFSAADAESVRIALQQSGSPSARVWAGTVHDAPGTPHDALATASILVLQTFDEPLRDEDMQALEQAAAGSLATHRVQRVRTYLSADRRRTVSLYQAPDTESVRLALEHARMPVEQVWSYRLFSP